jgi:hypothetical protein
MGLNRHGKKIVNTQATCLVVEQVSRVKSAMVAFPNSGENGGKVVPPVMRLGYLVMPGGLMPSKVSRLADS